MRSWTIPLGEEEAFAIKMRIHSDIGLRLLATHKVLREGGLTELKEAENMEKHP